MILTALVRGVGAECREGPASGLVGGEPDAPDAAAIPKAVNRICLAERRGELDGESGLLWRVGIDVAAGEAPLEPSPLGNKLEVFRSRRRGQGRRERQQRQEQGGDHRFFFIRNRNKRNHSRHRSAVAGGNQTINHPVSQTSDPVGSGTVCISGGASGLAIRRVRSLAPPNCTTGIQSRRRLTGPRAVFI